MSGPNQRRSCTSSSAAHTGAPSTNPTPDVNTRPPRQRCCKRSAMRPPTSAPATPPVSAPSPNCPPTRATEKYPDQRRGPEHEDRGILKVVGRTRGHGTGFGRAPHGERHEPPHRPGDPHARTDAEQRGAELRRNPLE